MQDYKPTYKIPPRIKTPILNTEGRPINYNISGGSLIFITSKNTNDLLGSMEISYKKDHVYIHRMDNFTSAQEKPLKNVGSLLVEYAFRKSIDAGFGGKIELDAMKTSPAAFYKMGFRKKCSAAIWLAEPLYEYQYASTESIREKKKKEILNHSFYEILVRNAAGNLNKEITDISFEEAIKHGLTNFYTDCLNKEFEKFLAENKKADDWDCDRLLMTGTMYLPPNTIELLKKKYFDSATPILSTFFFGSEYAKQTLKNPKIKDLFFAGKLNSSNAVDIESKFEDYDPRLDILLSPIGLEMMRRNHISGWSMGVYIFNLNYFKAIITLESLNAFEKSFINILQLVELYPPLGIELLSDVGLQALYDGDIKISDSGYSIADKQGNCFTDPNDLKQFLQDIAREEIKISENTSSVCSMK